MKTTKAAAPKTIDEYLARLPPDQRSALGRVRRTIRAAAPDAVEYIGYGLAGFKLNGRPLIYFGASKEHIAIYGPAVVPFAGTITGFETQKGTVRFTPQKPLPASIVTKIVKARAAQLTAPAPGPRSPRERRSPRRSATPRARARRA